MTDTQANWFVIAKKKKPLSRQRLDNRADHRSRALHNQKSLSAGLYLLEKLG